MRRGTIGTAICGIPCEIVYDYGDPLPATQLEPPEPAEVVLVEVRDRKGRNATWLERKMGVSEWGRIKEQIEAEERL